MAAMMIMVVGTFPVIMKTKFITPTTDVDLAGPADNVLVTHEPKEARINMTWGNCPVDIIEGDVRSDGRDDYDCM
ncbi:hypothetical protein AHF37_10773 [Paragonimus kellicotti]|nr:hypothetical protein AHF37_10773 [Paragonimus kellicotti]